MRKEIGERKYRRGSAKRHRDAAAAIDVTAEPCILEIGQRVPGSVTAERARIAVPVAIQGIAYAGLQRGGCRPYCCSLSAPAGEHDVVAVRSGAPFKSSRKYSFEKRLNEEDEPR